MSNNNNSNDHYGQYDDNASTSGNSNNNYNNSNNNNNQYNTYSLNSSNSSINTTHSNTSNSNMKSNTSEVDLFALTSKLNTNSDVDKLMLNQKAHQEQKTMSYLNTKTEQEIEKENTIIKNLNPIYFEQSSDIVQHILDQIPGDCEIDHLDGLTVKISGYHEAVDSRFNDLIRKSYSGFVKGLSQVYEIEKDLQHSATMCKSGKEYLNGVMKNLTSFGFILLEKHRRRELTKFMLGETQSFKDISQIARQVDSLLNENQFTEALIFLNKYNQEISTYSAKYNCIKDLASRFQSSVDAIIEKIDSNFVKVCHGWSEKEFENIVDGYSRLHQVVRFREKIHQNFILNIDDLSKKILKTQLLANFERPDEVNFKTMKFTDMCELLKEDQYVPALLSLLNLLSDLMWSHYMMKNWILVKSQSKEGEEKNFYIDIFKLLYSNRKTMWNSIQSQIRHILNSFKPKFKIEEFLKVLDSINQFIEVGNEFSGEEANILKSIMKEKSLAYFQFFHKKRIDDLKTMLENEIWHKMPLPNNFTVLDIKEFGVVMKLNNNLNNSNNSNNSGGSNNKQQQQQQQVFSTIFKVTEQKQISLELKDHDIAFMNQFRENGNPFSSAESRRTLNEASGDQFDQQNESTNGTNQQTNSPLIASTTVNVLRFIGKYFQMMKVLQPLSYPIFTAIAQLLEYYVYTVFNFFGSSSSSMFDDSSNVNPMLKKTMQRLKAKFNSNAVPSPNNHGKMSSPYQLKNDNSKSPNLSNTKDSLLSVTTPSVLSLSTPNLTVGKDNRNGGAGNNSTTNGGGDNFDDGEISIQWVLPTLSELVDLTQSKNLYGLENKIIGLESMMFLVEAIMEAQPLVMSLVPNEKSSAINDFYVQTVSVVASLKNLCYKNITSQLLNLDNIQNLVTGIKWELKEAPTTESNNYISQIIIEFHRFTGYLDEISSRSGILTPKVKNLLWENTITFAMETLIESYSKIKKCNNYGRNLMIMDLKKLQAGLESLTTIRPIPHIQHVDQYITAYYLPESDLFSLARDSEFTCKQVISIVNVCGHLKKNEKQKLINDLEDLDKQRKLESKSS
ncbi:hypothetical protein CYY_009098 [Polysphondylium violaceum]|uniref:Uncharacterized protein n=1 Tax=Polysphondylium violaceum TaxID=133409 RepID=A0A8J4V3B7_9MYCE|nr:hypothetical protein CYY_009098 [Polysphondylium violaceum]